MWTLLYVDCLLYSFVFISFVFELFLRDILFMKRKQNNHLRVFLFLENKHTPNKNTCSYFKVLPLVTYDFVYICPLYWFHIERYQYVYRQQLQRQFYHFTLMFYLPAMFFYGWTTWWRKHLLWLDTFKFKLYLFFNIYNTNFTILIEITFVGTYGGVIVGIYRRGHRGNRRNTTWWPHCHLTCRYPYQRRAWLL